MPKAGRAVLQEPSIARSLRPLVPDQYSSSYGLRFSMRLKLRGPVRDDRQRRGLHLVRPGVDQETLAIASDIVKPRITRKLKVEQRLRRKHAKFLWRLPYLDRDDSLVSVDI